MNQFAAISGKKTDKLTFATRLRKKMLLFVPVKIGKVIISLFLLMAYIIGYAHALLPHHQEMDTVELFALNIDGEHHHHSHSQKTPDLESENNNLISHELHYDKGFFDLVYCLISDVEHPENDCNLDFYDFAKPELISSKNNVKVRFIAVLVAVMIPGFQNENATDIATGSPVVYQSPVLQQSPNRGPPLHA
jgi:hypothetical protein